MDTRIIDLHVHSNASDGTCTPTQLVAEAKKAGLSAFALTDHDTTDGITEAAAAAEEAGMELIPGVELSTEYEGKEIHVLGLYIDITNESLQKHMEAFRDSRDNRNIYMLEKGYIPDIKTAFCEYIGEGCRCYVDRPKVTPMDAADYILEAGGIPILAHPVMYHMPRPQLKRMIAEMKEHALAGIEAVYSENTPADEQDYQALAREEGLLISGGSDFHGANKPAIRLGSGRGKLHVPYSFLEAIKQSRA